MLAGSVNAQTITGKITKDWEHSMGSYTTGVARDCGQLGKQALVANKATGMIEVWDATGKVNEYNVNQWLIDNKADINSGMKNHIHWVMVFRPTKQATLL